jgi:hypothetical protein
MLRDPYRPSLAQPYPQGKQFWYRSTDYKVGDVALVTARNRTTPYRAHFNGREWVEHGSPNNLLRYPASLRLLHVLDLRNETTTEEVCRVLSEEGFQNLVEEIQAQHVKPRLPEPTTALAEVWASTEGTVRRRFVRAYGEKAICAWADGGSHAWRWDDLIDPVIVSEER